MAAPRIPTKMLELRGAFSRNPQRREGRRREPRIVAQLGAPPPSLNQAQRSAWAEIVAAAPPGVLTAADRYIVEITARLLVRMRKGELNGFLAQQLRGCLASLGMTPADRSRVSTQDEPPESDPWDELGGAEN